MTRHLYVIAHRGGARVFEQIGVRPILKLVGNIDNPEGYLKESEIVSDRPGSFAYGSGRSSAENNDTQREHLLEKFARELGTYIENEVEATPTTSVVLVAEPHILGVLRKFIGKATEARLQDAVNKDLANIADRDMANALSKFLTHREQIQAG